MSTKCSAPSIRNEQTKDGCSSSATQATYDRQSFQADLDIVTLRDRIAAMGVLGNELVYVYVVRTIRLINGLLSQTGSAPNFNGGLITLCTCKHSMRSWFSPEEWSNGVWVAGLTSLTDEFNRQQSLVYLMRVGEAYPSHFDLVQQLRASGRTSVVEAKNSTKHQLGDLMMPTSASIEGKYRFLIPSYHPPMLKHSHRQNNADNCWHKDIDYKDARTARRPAMLVGDPNFSFVWTKPIVQRRVPRPFRGSYKCNLARLLNEEMRGNNE